MREQSEPSRREFVAAFGLAGAYAAAIHVPQLWPRRQEILARIDPIARYFGGYSAYQLNEAEYIGTATRGLDSIDLDQYGYDRNPLAAAKYHPESAELDDGTWRRIDKKDHRWQWHVHVWENDEQTEIFSHYEYRPDPWLLGNESASDMQQRLRDHYNPRWDIIHGVDDANYFLGAACQGIRNLVNDR